MCRYSIAYLFVLCSASVLASKRSPNGNGDEALLVGIVDAIRNSSMSQITFVQDYLNKMILPHGWSLEIKYVPDPKDHALLADVTGAGLYRIASLLDDLNVTALVGPGSSTSTKLMHAFAAGRKIPHLPPFATDPSLGQSSRFPMLIRLSPPDTFQTEAVVDIIQFYGWNRVSMITTDDDYGFGASTALLAVASVRSYKVEVIARLQVVENADDLSVSDSLELIQALGPHPVVVVTGGANAKVILNSAYARGMTTEDNWFWILMDGAAVDEVLSVYAMDEKATTRLLNGLIGTRPVMSQGLGINILTQFWEENHIQEFPWKNGFGFAAEKVSDALLCIAQGFSAYWQQKKATLSKPSDIDGELLRDAILRVQTEGLASHIGFDKNGKIASTEYDILVPNNGLWESVGRWSLAAKLNMSYAFVMNYSKSLRMKGRMAGRTAPKSSLEKEQTFASALLSGRTQGRELPIIHVVTIAEAPFVIVAKNKTSQETLTNRVFAEDVPPHDRMPGMDVWLEGYCVDMLQKLSEIGRFRYTLRLVEDSSYGGRDPETGEWNGMIGDVVRGRAHLAAASITVTEQRSEDVDFATSFMDVALKYIVTRAAIDDRAPEDSDAFAFLRPFHFSLWGAIGVCVVCLSTFLHFLSRLSPYGARGHFFLSDSADQFRRSASVPQAQRAAQGVKENTAAKQLLNAKSDAERAMGFNNALYFVWASLFWQTPERVPRAPSARLVTAVWYLAAVVFVAAYTANMVAFVTSKHEVQRGLHSVSDLLSQIEITYGTVADSSVEYILSSSGIAIAKQIYDVITSDQERYMVETTDEGLNKVMNGTYALLWDSLSLDYWATESECELKTVDVGFGAVQYAFAVKKGSALTPILSQYILKLRETGVLSTLWHRYFGFVEACSKLDDHNIEEIRVHELTFSNLAGVFYLVFFAMAVGLPILACEWIAAAFFDVNRNDPFSPQTISEAFRIRRNRLMQDIAENWVPVAEIKKRWSTLELPSTDLAQSIIDQRITRSGRDSSKEGKSNRSSVNSIRGYCSENDISSRVASKQKKKTGFTKSLRRLASSHVTLHIRPRGVVPLGLRNTDLLQ